jgi:hypothetical protein
MRVCSRLADDFVVDRDQASAALAVPEESAAPVSSITAVSVATERVSVVDELKVLLTTLLVARHRNVVNRLDFFHLTLHLALHVNRSMLMDIGAVLNEVNCNERRVVCWLEENKQSLSSEWEIKKIQFSV